MNYRKQKFDLVKALNGSDVITRLDTPVRIVNYNQNAKSGMGLVGWVEDELITWNDNGKFLKDQDSVYDLFVLEPDESIGFVNVHEDGHGKWVDERIYDYYTIAAENGALSPTYKGTIEIELP